MYKIFIEWHLPLCIIYETLFDKMGYLTEQSWQSLPQLQAHWVQKKGSGKICITVHIWYKAFGNHYLHKKETTAWLKVSKHSISLF